MIVQRKEYYLYQLNAPYRHVFTNQKWGKTIFLAFQYQKDHFVDLIPNKNGYILLG